MTELQQKLLTAMKESGFRKSQNDLCEDFEDAFMVRAALEKLEQQGMIFKPYAFSQIRVSNKAWLEMGWVDREQADANTAKLQELEQQLRGVLTEMAKIRPVQFYDVDSEYVYALKGVSESYDGNKVFVELWAPREGSERTSAFQGM